VRTICRSSTYQLSSTPNRYNADDRQGFSRYYPRRLNAEVLLDAVDAVTAGKTAFAGLPAPTRAVQLPDNSFNASSYFLTVFGRPEASSACECERSTDASLAQSLHLFNSAELQAKLAADTGRAAALVNEASRSDEEKVRDLYLLALSRTPDGDEQKMAAAHLARERKGPDGQPLPAAAAKRQAYEDLVWALMNTKEFLFNH
jgi:predicted DNA-binding protein